MLVWQWQRGCFKQVQRSGGVPYHWLVLIWCIHAVQGAVAAMQLDFGLLSGHNVECRGGAHYQWVTNFEFC